MTSIQPKTNDYSLPDPSLPKATNQYDQSMFLKLLMAQLGNQDPMSPMEDREFIAQMAQFSSLEQMQTISKQLDSSSRRSAQVLRFLSFSNMIGKNGLIMRRKRRRRPSKDLAASSRFHAQTRMAIWPT